MDGIELTVYAEGTSRLEGFEGVLHSQYSRSYFTDKNSRKIKINYGSNVGEYFYLDIAEKPLAELLEQYKAGQWFDLKGSSYYIHACTLITCQDSDVWSIELDISKDENFCPCYIYVPIEFLG